MSICKRSVPQILEAWFLKEFRQWIQGDSKLLICAGMGISYHINNVLTIAAGAGKSFLTCDSFHDCLNDRSIAIEYLRKRWQVIGIPVFFYFNSKEYEKQSPNMVLACLLKQLAILTNRIHPRLKNAYDSRVRPQRSDLIDIFKAYCDDFSLNIYRHV